MKKFKLRISRQTLRPITSSQLRDVAGAGPKVGDSEDCVSRQMSVCVRCPGDSLRMAICA